MFKNKMQQLKNSIAIVKQINRGEWEFKGFKSRYSNEWECFTATRGKIELWVANGAWSCSVRDKRWELGFIGGWIVWSFAAGKKVKKMEKKMAKIKLATDLTK